MITPKLALCATLLFSGLANQAYAETLTLNVKTSAAAGNLRAAVYDSQTSYDDGKTVTGMFGKAEIGTTKLTFKDLKPGTYGVAVYQDLNLNEKLDRSLLGAPNEPFGFSNNPVIGFSAPKFGEFKIEFDGTPTEINIKLNGG